MQAQMLRRFLVLTACSLHEPQAATQAQVQEAKDKLAQEKVSRMIEAEEKLDQACCAQPVERSLEKAASRQLQRGSKKLKISFDKRWPPGFALGTCASFEESCTGPRKDRRSTKAGSGDLLQDNAMYGKWMWQHEFSHHTLPVLMEARLEEIMADVRNPAAELSDHFTHILFLLL